MHRTVRFGVTAPLALMAATALAQNEEGLSGKVAFGYLATSGNSDNENMNLTFGGDYVKELWQHSLDGQAVRASASDVTTAEAYALSWQSRRSFGEHNYVFGRVAWNQDKFSGYDEQIREVIGYGRRFVDRERHFLDAEAGAGLRQSDLRDGTSDDESILRLALDYKWDISDTADFNQTFAIESGSANTYTEWVSSLSADILENFAIVLSYTVKHNSDVPVGTEKRDTFTAVSLEYSF